MSAGVYEVGGADLLRVSRLRLSFRESAALAASMLYVLTGLAGYVMVEQGDPDASDANLLHFVNLAWALAAAVLVGRLVKDAKEQPRNTAGGVQMVANPVSAQSPADGADMV